MENQPVMPTPVEDMQEQLLANAMICTPSTALTSFPAMLCEPYRTDGVGIIVCERGEFDFNVGGKKFTAHAGETTFLPNDAAFHVLSQSEDLLIRLLIYQVDPIRDNLGTTVTAMQIYLRFYPHRHHVFHTGKEQELIRYIELISATVSSSHLRFTDYEQQLLLISLTYHLCSIFQKKMLESGSLHARRTEIFLQLIELIDQCYTHQRGVEFYAERLCLSAKYLSDISKTVCGYTVQELVFKSIIRKSKTLLCTSNKSVKEISDFFHFPNPSSYGTFFKKQIGMSPQQYRDAERKNKKK